VAEKKRSGVLTMSDLEDFAFELTQKLPELVQGFSKQWDYWMVDEFQDTSPKQVAILKSLIGDRLQYYVGDPQQSIYLFRGARSEVFFKQEQLISKSQGLVQQKMINYRSEKSLLHFLNWFFKNLGPQFSQMQPGNVTHSAERYQAEVFRSDSFSDDLLGVAAVQKLLQNGVAPSEIMVLARTNDLLGEFGSRLTEAQIPHQILSGGKFFDKPEVRDALALLKFLVTPQDSVNLVSLLRCPSFHVLDSVIQQVRKGNSSRVSLWAQIKNLDQPVIQKLRSYLEMTEQKGILYVWREALFQEGYVQGLRREDPSGRKESNLFKLIHSVFVAERKPDFSVSQFLHQLELGQEDPESTEGEALPILAPQKVNLMTIHASKGLQAKYVVLLGCGAKPPPESKAPLWISEKDRSLYFGLSDEEGQRQWPPGFDSIKEEWRARELEEFDRLLYVALTRAEKSISLVCSKIQTGSWAERWALPQDEGEHRFESFTVFIHQINDGNFLNFESGQIEAANQPLRSRPPPVLNSSKTMKTLSVSALLESKDQISEPLFKQKFEATSPVSSIKKVKRVLRGVEIHRVFERLKYTNTEIDAQAVAEDLKENIKDLLMQTEVPLRQIIQNGFVEWGFGVRIKNCLVQGQIDLWGFSESGELWIVDYKTGNPEHSEKAFKQLEIYALALYKVGKAKSTHKVKLCVLYPFDKTPFRVSACPTFEDIESRLQDI
jgi:ATP-dependent helicase/nuclease subunit A